MPVSADTHIILDIHTPKKDATIGEGAPTVPDGSIAIWANGIANPRLTTQTIATWRTLFRAAMENLNDGAVGVAVAGPIDVSAHNVAVAAPQAGEIGLYIGADTAAGDRSHFFDRTLKRLLELWLELAKDGSGDTPALRGFVRAAGDNNWNFGGEFWSGDDIDILLRITDPDGQSEEESMQLKLPPLPGNNVIYNPEAVAQIVCQMIDGLVHWRCSRTGTMIDISPAAPANSVFSRLTAILQ